MSNFDIVESVTILIEFNFASVFAYRHSVPPSPSYIYSQHGQHQDVLSYEIKPIQRSDEEK